MKKENCQRLRQSLEVHSLFRNFVIIAVTGLLFWVLYLFRFPDEPHMANTMLFITAPFALFYLVRILLIFRKAESYVFQRCTLTQPHSIPFLRSMAFHVVFPFSGKNLSLETRAIFASYGMMEPRMENYNNKTVTIAYNPQTGRVVVIG